MVVSLVDIIKTPRDTSDHRTDCVRRQKDRMDPSKDISFFLFQITGRLEDRLPISASNYQIAFI